MNSRKDLLLQWDKEAVRKTVEIKDTLEELHIKQYVLSTEITLLKKASCEDYYFRKKMAALKAQYNALLGQIQELQRKMENLYQFKYALALEIERKK